MARELQVWNPFREMEQFRRTFDELFDRFLGGRAALGARPLQEPAVESFVEGDKLIVRADLPGIEAKDVEVTVTGDLLTIKGKREQRKEEKNRNFFYREVNYGDFERALTLPPGVKAASVQASFSNGVLQLTMPVPKEMAPQKIAVQIEEKAKAKGSTK